MDHEEMINWYYGLLIFPIRLPFLEHILNGKYVFDERQARILGEMDRLFLFDIKDRILDFEKNVI
jgi:hypothetical protein